MGRELVLVGGGHAHLTVLSRIDRYVRRGHRVTLVSPGPYHYYSGMGPGLLSGIYRPRETRFHIRRLAEERGARFVEDEAVRIDAAQRRLFLASGNELGYDVVSFNTGSGVPLAKVAASGPEVVAVKPIVHLWQARQRIVAALGEGSPRLLVVGGGPAGLELSGNLRRLVEDHGGRAQIDLVAGRRLMGGFPDRLREMALASLQRRGVKIHEGVRARRVQGGTALLDDGRPIDYDLAFIAVGIEPSTIFRDSGLSTGDDGGLLVDACLQSVDHPGLFGGGDCICFRDRPLDKVGVYAVRQNPILDHNLLAALEGGNLRTFEPQKDYLLIFNLGDGRGIFRYRRWVWDGRAAFWLKDRIDRRFMKRFQLCGERSEPAEPVK